MQVASNSLFFLFSLLFYLKMTVYLLFYKALLRKLKKIFFSAKKRSSRGFAPKWKDGDLFCNKSKNQKYFVLITLKKIKWAGDVFVVNKNFFKINKIEKAIWSFANHPSMLRSCNLYEPFFGDWLDRQLDKLEYCLISPIKV